jgi:L-ascorbate metabolism protein UlaG (beta-lactamase superfamily)
MMRLWLIRHATLRMQVAGLHLLVDPQLDPAGARPPVEGTPEPRRNPLVELPEPAQVVVQHLDGVLVTHRHQDHLDATALELLPRDVPVLCQPPDAGPLRAHGFADVRPVEERAELGPVAVARTGGRHGHGELAERMGPVSGFVLSAPGEGSLYVAGDTVWCEEVAAALDEHRPDVAVVNAGAARFREGEPITMDAEDVIAVARHAPDARVVAVHMEAVNHCLLTRADLHQILHEQDLTDRVTVPEDGAEVPLP